METDYINLMRKRLKAVLAYDGIAEHDMHIYLAKVLQVSKPVAKRMLEGKSRIFCQRPSEVAQALDVDCEWLYVGKFGRYHNRTMRINMQTYKGYPKEIVDKAMRFNFAFVAGQTKAKNLMNLIAIGKMKYADAAMIF